MTTALVGHFWPMVLGMRVHPSLRGEGLRTETGQLNSEFRVLSPLGLQNELIESLLFKTSLGYSRCFDGALAGPSGCVSSHQLHHSCVIPFHVGKAAGSGQC